MKTLLYFVTFLISLCPYECLYLIQPQLQSRNRERCITKVRAPQLESQFPKVSHSWAAGWLHVPCSSLSFIMIVKSYVKMLTLWRQWISHPKWSFYLFMSSMLSHLCLWNRTGSVCSQTRSSSKGFRIWLTAESMRRWWSNARRSRCSYSPKISNRDSLLLNEKKLRTFRPSTVVHCFLCGLSSLPQAHSITRCRLGQIYLYPWQGVEREERLCWGARVTTIG